MGKMTLDDWQKSVLPALRKAEYPTSNINRITLLAYFFWDDDRINSKFYTIECAILSAFRCFGKLKTILVVNRLTDQIKSFSRKYGIDLQIDVSLTGGIGAMNLDCIEKLPERFSTDYVLIVESDGLPVNSGIERYLDTYDYVGAPWGRHTSWRRHLPYAKYLVGNSGFSLRSRRLCKRASNLYRKFFKRLRFNWFLNNDVFCCRTLRMLFPSYRREFSFPTPEDAGRFSLERNLECLSSSPPIGFHGEIGFQNYVSHYGIPFHELMPGT